MRAPYIFRTCLLANRLMLIQLDDKKREATKSVINFKFRASWFQLIVGSSLWDWLMLLLLLELVPWKVPRAT